MITVIKVNKFCMSITVFCMNETISTTKKETRLNVVIRKPIFLNEIMDSLIYATNHMRSNYVESLDKACSSI